MTAPPDIFSIQNQKQFEKIALKTFRHQYDHNPVYQDWCKFLKADKQTVSRIAHIPFLPISFFKSHAVLAGELPVQTTFRSSGTTGMTTSQHLITDLSLYEASYRNGFAQFYGNIENYTILAVLPSYLERADSSLIYMVDDLIRKSNKAGSGFYLHNYSELLQTLKQLDKAGETVLLIGVTYALLDLIEQESLRLNHTIIMETGGMKGKRKELIREDLHQQLCKGFGVKSIHSEYGMTELLSQAYSFGAGRFECPQWMQVYIRDTDDALSYVEDEKTGGINVIDLANFHSCSFIATQDLGKKYANGSFEVLGRFDASDSRGCNLMVL